MGYCDLMWEIVVGCGGLLWVVGDYDLMWEIVVGRGRLWIFCVSCTRSDFDSSYLTNAHFLTDSKF